MEISKEKLEKLEKLDNYSLSYVIILYTILAMGIIGSILSIVNPVNIFLISVKLLFNLIFDLGFIIMLLIEFYKLLTFKSLTIEIIKELFQFNNSKEN